MAESKNILNQKSPGLSNFRPEFIKPDFDQAIWAKGYDVILERAMRCPCHGKGAPLIDCQNCFGTGYFYVNPVKTKGLITGVNQNNQYKTWSEELLGTIAITVMEVDKINLSYFDRIKFMSEISYFSENLEIRSDGDVYFVFTTYQIESLLGMYIFVSSNEKLQKTNAAHVSENNPYCLILDLDELPSNNCISVYYKHCPEYHVLDLPHEIRSSWNTNRKTGQMFEIKLPLQAIARRSHLIAIEKPNFDGSGVIINDNI